MWPRALANAEDHDCADADWVALAHINIGFVSTEQSPGNLLYKIGALGPFPARGYPYLGINDFCFRQVKRLLFRGNLPSKAHTK